MSDERPEPPPEQGSKPASDRRKSFPSVWFDDAQMPEASAATIKNLLNPGDLAVVFGVSGCGKTFFVGDMVLHVACEMTWRGRKVVKSLVVYIAAEAGNGILKRIIAWREQKLGDSSSSGRVPFHILTRGPDLLSGVDVDMLMQQLRAISSEMGMPIGVVVFDTLSRSIPGGEENGSEDMSRVIQVADEIREKFGSAVVFVHHSGKDPARGMRGFSGLYAAADLVISVEKGLATVDKLRDGVEGETFPFKLHTVEVGTDADGEPITTCLVDHDAEAPPPAAKAGKLSGSERIALASLQEVLGEHGEAMPGTSTIPQGVRAVGIERWRERFYKRYGNDKKDPQACKVAFRRGRDALHKAQLVGIFDEWCWLGRAS